MTKKQKPLIKGEYDTFSDALKTVLSVPRSEMVAALAEEKVRKADRRDGINTSLLIREVSDGLL